VITTRVLSKLGSWIRRLGEFGERRLEHGEREAEKFYRDLKRAILLTELPVVKVGGAAGRKPLPATPIARSEIRSPGPFGFGRDRSYVRTKRKLAVLLERCKSVKPQRVRPYFY
jgi:hypothetical protein